MEAHLNHIKEKVEEYLYEIKILYEKLSYRLKIREEKIKEAELKKKQFQKWSSDKTEKLNKLSKKYKSDDEKRRQKNAKLKEELYKMTESYETLKEKFKHFEKHDEVKFKEIYEMKKEDIKELALKVLLADKTIKTQQLGMENFANEETKGFTYEELIKDQAQESNVQKKKKTPEEERADFERSIVEKIEIPKVKGVFELIIREAEFLIDSETLKLCEGYTFEEKLPIYIECICKALSIKSESELNDLIDLFFKEAEQIEEEIRKQEEEKHTEEANDEDLAAVNNAQAKKEPDLKYIDEDRVLPILFKFHEDKKLRGKENSKKIFK